MGNIQINGKWETVPTDSASFLNEGEAFSLPPGTFIREKKTGIIYRVLKHRSLTVRLIETAKTGLNMTDILFEELMASLRAAEIELVVLKDQQVLDMDNFKNRHPREYEKWRHKVAFLKEIEKAYGPFYDELATHKPKREFEALRNKFGFKRPTAWRMIWVYLEFGLDPVLLINKNSMETRRGYGTYNYKHIAGRPASRKKPAPPLDDEMKKHFDKAVNYFLSKKKMTQKKAYEWMIGKYYARTIMVMDEEGGHMPMVVFNDEDGNPIPRPSYRQFTYYFKKHVDEKTLGIRRLGGREWHNTHRPLFSDVYNLTDGPGHVYMIDEYEANISIRSTVIPGKADGKPILYALIDVYSRIITAVYISFENNSTIGFTGLMYNLSLKKPAYCSQYGITASEKEWPSGYLPHVIMTDRGAEYLSAECFRIANENGITLETCPPASGSKKGVIEGWFAELQIEMDQAVEGIGGYSTRYQADYHKRATLELDEFKQLVLTFVLYHNTRAIPGFRPTADMILNKVEWKPCELWEYGMQKFNSQMPIPNRTQFLYSLMKPINATLSREGVSYKGLHYINKDPDLLSKVASIGAGKKEAFDCRIDPRDIGTVYYIRDHELKTLHLNSNKAGSVGFAGMTLSDWETIYNDVLAQRVSSEESQHEHRLILRLALEKIITNAKKGLPGRADPTEMKYTRAREKAALRNYESFYQDLRKDLKLDTFEPDQLDTTDRMDKSAGKTDPSKEYNSRKPADNDNSLNDKTDKKANVSAEADPESYFSEMQSNYYY